MRERKVKFIDCKFGPMEEEEEEEGERTAGEKDGNLHTQRRTKNDQCSVAAAAAADASGRG